MSRPKPIHFQSRYAPRWTDEEIRRFINMRIKYDSLFDDRLYSTQEVWEKIADEARIPENWRRLKKKWSNLIYKYRKIHFRPNQNTPLSITWPFFELLHKFESKRCDRAANVSISKKAESLEDTNSEDYLFLDTSNYLIEEEPREIRTYTRVAGMRRIKSAEPKQPLIRVDKSIFKSEPLDVDSEPMVFKVEDDSDTEVYELIPSPKQDYPSDPVEYETYDEIQEAASFNTQLSPQPFSLVANGAKPDAAEDNHLNEEHNQIPLKLGKSSLCDEPKKKKSKKTPLDEEETMGEKKLRREILKCTNVFLKFMKMKYDIEPDPISSESETE